MPSPEHIAFFEEFLLNEPGMKPKSLGVRRIEENADNRTLGVYGRREMVLMEPLVLEKCFKQIVVKASVKKPLRVQSMLQRLEGRYK